MSFSVFFTVIVGAVLLASNLSGSKGKWVVIGFGILYTSAMMLVLNLIPHPNSGLTLALNGGGALVLTNLFWNKFVGKERLFRTKPIWKPLIISVIISIPFILAIIYG
jgi:drug/metabolite transporter superfamily protein YnfA